MQFFLLNRCSFCGRRHYVFDVALSRSKLGGSGLVRECSISATAYASDVPAFSRTNGTPPGPLPQNRFPSVGYRLFDKRRLAGHGVSPVTAKLPSASHRRQAASHSCVLAVRPGGFRSTAPSLHAGSRLYFLRISPYSLLFFHASTALRIFSASSVLPFLM